MYSYIKGSLEEVFQDHIVVENQGIGYRIFVSSLFIQQLPARGEMVKIYTYTYVREDQLGLFGFGSREDLELFELLIGVSGIGPKGALAVLSTLSARDLRFAILAEDAKTIEKCPGIGKKTAQRVIIELKDKMNIEQMLDVTAEAGPAVVGTEETSNAKTEAVMALTALGYSSSEALKALQHVEITESMDVEAVLKEALKQMAFI